ncbi:hypothetical protein [Geodermatophilus sp. DSM 44513]|uniref:aa3-type cytochrome oxidase subunit CtaJ n=1 Tax=Geodermatophilus sp. DSM 44513 TaxID=1528104 RepID=UPI00127AF436|nr:hypothetical protein [Geodermatophilus sp. DSM 44513]WNV76905.1 hypothetical protein RTG05_06420 [Geodermatophilus sp. DSM 44513]
MTVVETLLVYAGAPLAVVLLLAVLTLIPGRRRKLRYKPGQPWEHEPVWYEPHPAAGGGGHAATPGTGAAALGSSLFPEQGGEGTTGRSAASHSGGDGHHGATRALTAGPSAVLAARPLGGARGTW